MGQRFARKTPLRFSRHIKVPLVGKTEIGDHDLKKSTVDYTFFSPFPL
jgi:hypothetical protein